MIWVHHGCVLVHCENISFKAPLWTFDLVWYLNYTEKGSNLICAWTEEIPPVLGPMATSYNDHSVILL